MVKEAQQCPSYIEVGETRVAIHCERNEGHRGKHREYFESTDESNGDPVSVIIEWVEQV